MTNRPSSTVAIPRRRRPKVDPAHPAYELDMWLVNSEPLIWRSLAVPANLTLGQLHWLIQTVMAWDNSHLHCFETRNHRRFEPSEPGGGVDAMWTWFGGNRPKPEDEDRVTLRDVFEELKQPLRYLYDYGDSWAHDIKLINTHEDAAAFAHLPICLAGERAGPPEDCGGVWGYAEKLEILRHPDPDDEWHQQVIEWMDEFDPEAFDLDAKNRRIEAVWSRRPAPSRPARQRPYKRRKRKSR